MCKNFFVLFLCFGLLIKAHAQENYEIQVYPSETVAKGSTMLELHSNFTFGGQQYVENGVLPTHNVAHETIEITRGITDIFETGFYFFNAIGSDHRTTFVGTHIRPRLMAPEKWHLPFGLSLSAEFGYQKLEYSEDDWNIEIRPIIDKTWGRLYISFNPSFEKSIHGLNQHEGFDFSPNLKAGYDITKKVALGFEYYGAVGDISTFDPYLAKQQQHQLFFVVDLNISRYWEFNAGYGLGFTPTTDNDIFKMIVGYRFHKKEKKNQ